jgi:cyclic beta-1,2-glucan synthetase
MLDNLRRSLLAPFTLMALGLCWLLPMPSGIKGTLLVLAAVAIPAFVPILFSLVPRRTGIRLLNHIGVLAADLRLAAIRTLLSFAFLADQAWRMGDAIVRTLARLFATRRHLLEWTTAARSTGKSLTGYQRPIAMAGASFSLSRRLARCIRAPTSWPPCLCALLAGSAGARLVDQPVAGARRHAVAGCARPPHRASNMAVPRPRALSTTC